ncbi:unnamed protein product [Camellia sinensis]
MGDLLSGRSTDWHTIGDIFRSNFFDNIINRDIPWPKIPDEMSYEAYDLIDKLGERIASDILIGRNGLELASHEFNTRGRVFMTLLDRYSFMFSFIFSAATTIRRLRHLEIQLEFDALKPFILLYGIPCCLVYPDIHLSILVLRLRLVTISRLTGMAKLVNRVTLLGIVRLQSWSPSFHSLAQTQVPNQCNESEIQALILRSTGMAKLVSRITQLGMFRVQTQSYSMAVHAHTCNQNDANTVSSLEDQTKVTCLGGVRKPQIGENVSRKDKISFLVGTLLGVEDSKEAVYGVLDAWVAWEQNFPIGSLKNVLLALEKEQQWHRVVQVIKWMLSKGQGTTMRTYGQLIRALDMDHRVEEAHEFWVKKIGNDLHSVPWQLCDLMISVYYRNNRLENLVKLFKGLEAFDRKPPEKKVVKKVANAYEMLGLIEDRDRVLEKYKSLFSETGKLKKSRNVSKKKKK